MMTEYGCEAMLLDYYELICKIKEKGEIFEGISNKILYTSIHGCALERFYFILLKECLSLLIAISETSHNIIYSTSATVPSTVGLLGVSSAGGLGGTPALHAN